MVASTIIRSYKVELDPNNRQRTLLMKSAGAARFAYNWGIRRHEEVRMMNLLPVPHIKYPTAIDLHRELNALKKEQFPWMYEVSKCCPQEALRDLEVAYQRFFKGISRYPRMKSRKRGIGGFTVTDRNNIRIWPDSIQIPRLGRIRLKERGYLPSGSISEATMSERAGRWYVSLHRENEVEIPEKPRETIVGLDVGIKNLATLSDGTIFPNPRVLPKAMRKLNRLQRAVSRKVKGGANKKKAMMKLVRMHARIHNIRQDNINKITTILTKTKSVIGVESLNVAGMIKNHSLAGALADASMSEFLRQLKYKAGWYGCRIVEADQFFPSTKRCPVCGHVKAEMPLSERTYHCEFCGYIGDRDVTAAMNLKIVAVSSTETINACLRMEVTDLHSRCHPVMQESNTMPESVLHG